MQYFPITQSGRFDIDPVPLQSAVVGDTINLDLNTFLTQNAPAVTWSVVGGALPTGLSLSSSGIVSGTVLGYGPTIAQIRADSGSAGLAEQALAFDIPAEDGGGGGGTDTRTWGIGTGGIEIAFVDSQSTSWTVWRFTSTASFTVTTAGWFEILIVPSGGGGGGGAFVAVLWLEPGVYPCVVPAGGAAGYGTNSTRHGSKGSNASFGSLLTGFGGGGGQGSMIGTWGSLGVGGSGGGANYSGQVGASGTLGMGFKGGNAHPSSDCGGGGGGCGGPGQNAQSGTAPGNGGAGRDFEFSQSPQELGGGGAGGTYGTTQIATASHGGGQYLSENGAANTGGGGCGSGANTSAVNYNAGNGGSGLIEVRRKN